MSLDDDEMMDDEEVCGETFEHNIEETGRDEDGMVYWRCRTCGAEGWDEPPGGRPKLPSPDAAAGRQILENLNRSAKGGAR